MPKTLLLVILAALGGCGSSPICGYDLTSENWHPTQDVPLVVKSDQERNGLPKGNFVRLWFENPAGDYLACITGQTPSESCPYMEVMIYRVSASGEYSRREDEASIKCVTVLATDSVTL
jgi:hypothetical protein